jgi:hypothetical protein
MSDRPYRHTSNSEVATQACQRFFGEHDELHEFIGFVSDLALRADEISRKAREALFDRSQATPEAIAEHESALEKGAGAVQHLRRHSQRLLQMFLVRICENFLVYVSDLLALIFITRPETLRSNEQVRLDFLLEYHSMEELVAALADRRVNALSYRGMREIAKDVQQRLGFEIFADEESLDHAIRIIEMRNLIVHNRATINSLFIGRLSEYAGKEGEQLKLSIATTLESADFLASCVKAVDARAIAQFGLPLAAHRAIVDSDVTRRDDA